METLLNEEVAFSRPERRMPLGSASLKAHRRCARSFEAREDDAKGSHNGLRQRRRADTHVSRRSAGAAAPTAPNAVHD